MREKLCIQFFVILFVLEGIFNENTVPNLESDQIETEKVI